MLGCGILSSVLYASTDVLAGLRYDGYSFKSQAVSELSASAASTRSLIVGLFTTDRRLLRERVRLDVDTSRPDPSFEDGTDTGASA